MSEYRMKCLLDDLEREKKRAQWAEAECERLRETLRFYAEGRHWGYGLASGDGVESGAKAAEALATPPPDSADTATQAMGQLDEIQRDMDAPHSPEHRIGTWDEQADVPLCDWKPGMRNTPQQAHGDTLAALDDALTDCANLSLNAEQWETVRRLYVIAHNTLTASGVPGHWACKNPGRADQYRAEAMACRRALGFDEESHDVSPTDLTSAIADSGVPESVRELPAEWENGTEGMTDSAAAAYRCCARALRFALASAPAVLNRREIFYRLANYESDEPYEGGEDQPQFSYSRYVLDQWLVQDHRGDCTNEPFTCMRCFAERCWHKAGWIAAAPTDGRE